MTRCGSEEAGRAAGLFLFCLALDLRSRSRPLYAFPSRVRSIKADCRALQNSKMLRRFGSGKPHVKRGDHTRDFVRSLPTNALPSQSKPTKPWLSASGTALRTVRPITIAMPDQLLIGGVCQYEPVFGPPKRSAEKFGDWTNISRRRRTCSSPADNSQAWISVFLIWPSLPQGGPGFRWLSFGNPLTARGVCQIRLRRVDRPISKEFL